MAKVVGMLLRAPRFRNVRPVGVHYSGVRRGISEVSGARLPMREERILYPDSAPLSSHREVRPMSPPLRVFSGADSVPAPEPTVRISLREMLPLIALAQRHNYLWL